jgi:phage shock protein PspC (stress-responsive transcriptional regulator)
MDATTEQTHTTDRRDGGPPKRLERYPGRAPIGGVAEGLGVYFGLDPVIFRIAFVVLALAGGSGVLAYLIGWVAIPAASEVAQADGTPAWEDERARRWVGWGLIVLAVLLLAADPFEIARGGLLWGLALIIIGILLFRSDERRADPSVVSNPESSPPSTAAPAGTRQSEATRGPGEAVPTAPTDPAPPPRESSAPETSSEASLIGRMTVGVALLASGVAALLDAAGLVSIGATAYVALLLAITGGGLLVSAWWGRARWLIAAGLTLLILLAGSVTLGPDWRIGGGVGEREWVPRSAAEVESTYELFAGEGVLDLTEADLTDEVSIDVGVTFGSLTVIVPEGASVAAEGRVTAGDIDLLGARASGLSVERSLVHDADEDASHVELDLSAVFGEIIVRHP